MKSFKKIITMCLALVLCLSCVPAAFAAEVADATIDQNRKGCPGCHYLYTGAGDDPVSGHQ